MKKYKLIRATYPPELNVLLILLVFILTAFFSHHIFDVPFHEAEHRKAAYWGMFLIGIAAILVMLIVWEEILFPIKITELPNGIKLSNHRLKLKIQLLLYLVIPVIFGFIYLRYDLNHIHFFLWFGVCLAIPVLTKLFSGIKNYNDFLKLTTTEIEYKNNDKEGFHSLYTIKYLHIIKDKDNVLSKIIIGLNNFPEVTIDVDEMELEAFYDVITKYIFENYQPLLKQA